MAADWPSRARGVNEARGAASCGAPRVRDGGQAREQRPNIYVRRVHKTANVLNKLPKSVQPRAKQYLQDIWMAETKEDAQAAFDFFLEAYGPKFDKAVARSFSSEGLDQPPESKTANPRY